MQGKKDRKEFGPTARFKCTMLSRKVTQGDWIVSEKKPTGDQTKENIVRENLLFGEKSRS